MNLLHNYCLNHGRSQMNIRTRLIAAAVVALIVGFGFMAYDKYRMQSGLFHRRQLNGRAMMAKRA